jgi:hypothetical protein
MMAFSGKFKSKLSSDIVNGAVIGFVIGVAVTLFSWIFAGVIKLLLTWDTGIWPDAFPGHIPDFMLSGLWAIIIIVTFTVVGAIAGSIMRRRLKIL